MTRLKDYFRSILFTYIISYEYLQRNDASTAKLFNLFAYLDRSDLWYSLFTFIFDESIVSKEMLPTWFLSSMNTEFDFTQKIWILLDYSLIETTYFASVNRPSRTLAAPQQVLSALKKDPLYLTISIALSFIRRCILR